MLMLRPRIVVAFRLKGVSRGTDDMLARAKHNGVPTALYIDTEGWQ